MKKIRRNETRKIRNILEGAKEVEFFVSSNEYKGGKFANSITERQIGWIMHDIAGHHAVLFDNEDGTHTLYYASPCMRLIK